MRKSRHDSRDKNSYTPALKMCSYCGEEFRFLGNHTRFCPHNPHADGPTAAQILARKNATRAPHTKESKKKLSKVMKARVRKFPELYCGNALWHPRMQTYRGDSYHSAWEVIFAKYLVDKDIKYERNERAFAYRWRGERQYFPDFYLPGLKVFVEVKGRITERDKCKWRDFPKKLVVINHDAIDRIQKGKRIGLKLTAKELRSSGKNYLILARR